MPRKEKIPKDKVQINVLIDKKLYDELIKIAPEIYGQVRGSISYVVNEALKAYLAPRLHTQIHTNPKHKVREVYEQIVKAVMELRGYNFKPKDILEKDLETAIAEVRGSDPRTISKWKNILAKQGLIKFVGGHFRNRIVELL